MNKIYETEVAGRTLSLEFGKVAGLANGSVIVRYGDTVVVSASKSITNHCGVCASCSVVELDFIASQLQRVSAKPSIALSAVFVAMAASTDDAMIGLFNATLLTAAFTTGNVKTEKTIINDKIPK